VLQNQPYFFLQQHLSNIESLLLHLVGEHQKLIFQNYMIV